MNIYVIIPDYAGPGFSTPYPDEGMVLHINIKTDIKPRYELIIEDYTIRLKYVPFDNCTQHTYDIPAINADIVDSLMSWRSSGLLKLFGKMKICSIDKFWAEFIIPVFKLGCLYNDDDISSIYIKFDHQNILHTLFQNDIYIIYDGHKPQEEDHVTVSIDKNSVISIYHDSTYYDYDRHEESENIKIDIRASRKQNYSDLPRWQNPVYKLVAKLYNRIHTMQDQDFIKLVTTIPYDIVEPEEGEFLNIIDDVEEIKEEIQLW